MNHIATKIIGVIVVVLCALYISFNCYASVKTMTNRNEMLSETDNFINKVCDSGTCSDAMLQDYYLAMSSHGYAVNVDVNHYEAIVNPLGDDANAGTQTTYIKSSDISLYDTGDMIQVKVHFISEPSMNRIVYRIMHLYTPMIDFELSGMVRN